jgi:uncharacterized protein (DUF427 family)
MFPAQPIKPQPDQESVWDYPRPPRLELCNKHIQVIFNDLIIADTQRSQRVLETSHPPSYYIPPEDIKMEYFHAALGQSFCEWKGVARYYTIIVGDKQAVKAAWYYSNPTLDFAPIKNYVAIYAGAMDCCYVNDEIVTPQPGGFYGGWITNDIVGPFKGEPGTWGW